MLTPTPAARSFSDFLMGRTAAATDESTDAVHGHPLEARDQASYFDTIMRLRCRYPTGRCRRPFHS